MGFTEQTAPIATSSVIGSPRLASDHNCCPRSRPVPSLGRLPRQSLPPIGRGGAKMRQQSMRASCRGQSQSCGPTKSSNNKKQTAAPYIRPVPLPARGPAPWRRVTPTDALYICFLYKILVTLRAGVGPRAGGNERRASGSRVAPAPRRPLLRARPNPLTPPPCAPRAPPSTPHAPRRR